MAQRRPTLRRQERGEKPPATNRALSSLLVMCDVQVQELAEAAGRQPGTLSDYARRKTLPLEMYRALASLVTDPPHAERHLDMVEAIDRAEEVAITTPSALALELGNLGERLAVSQPQTVAERASQRERQKFETIWAALHHLTSAEWQQLMRALPSLRCPAFVGRLAEESERAASDDADRALSLASLCLWLAKRVWDIKSRRQCEGFAWGIVGNARRVRSELKRAKKAFLLSARFWQGESSSGASALPGWRLLDLEASLWIDLRKPDKALELLDQAAEASPQNGDAQARLFLKRSNALTLMGDTEGAIEAAQKARTLLSPDADPRLLWVLRLNLMESLCEVGRASEAEGQLDDLRALTVQIGNGLDSLRLRWLEAKIAAGVGRVPEAIEALSWVRADFADKKIRYDEALASLDLAVLYLERGRTGDVKRLVRQMEPVFRAEGVHAEAQNALNLFRRAVELETVTVELIRRISAYLYRAKQCPELRFEELETGCRGRDLPQAAKGDR